MTDTRNKARPAARPTIPDAVHDLIDWLVDVAYEQGYQAAAQDIATRHAELDAAWKPVGRRSYREQVADRMAAMARSARMLRGELDRHCPSGRGRDWPAVAQPGHPAGRIARMADQ